MRIKLILALLMVGVSLQAQTWQIGGNGIQYYYDAAGVRHVRQILTSPQPPFAVTDSLTKLQNSAKQTFGSYSVTGKMNVPFTNSGIVWVGDSNQEEYPGSVVDANSYVNIVTTAIQKTQGPVSDIAFTNFSDPTRYGITIAGSTSIVAKGPTNTALKMNAGSTITFTSAAEVMEFWYEQAPGAGTVEIRFNGTLYRTIPTAGTANPAISSFTSSTTPSGARGTYEIRCSSGSVTLTALFKSIHASSGYDTNYFIRAAVAGMTFSDFNPSIIRQMSGLIKQTHSVFLVALGTNSIYSPTKATTAAKFAADLKMYSDSLRAGGNSMIFLIPPRTLETSYPPILDIYQNYYNAILQTCALYNIRYIDLNEANLFLNPANFGPDGLHYSATGNGNLAAFITTKIGKIDRSNDGFYATLTGTNATWNGAKYNGGTLTTSPTYILGYDVPNTEWRSVDKPALKNFLAPTLDEVLMYGALSARDMTVNKVNVQSATADYSFMANKNGLNTGAGWQGILKVTDAAGNKGWDLGYLSASQTSVAVAGTNGPASSFEFWTYNGTNFGNALRINSDRSVNITTAPTTDTGVPRKVDVAMRAAAEPTASTTAGSDGQVFLGANYFYWYAGGRWNRVARDATF